MSKLLQIDMEDEGQTVVLTGNMEDGFRFWGPFDGQAEAEAFIKETVHPNLPAEWYFLETPPNSEDPNVIEGVIVSETDISSTIKDKGIPVLTLPVSHQIHNEAGRYIGDQLGMPGA